MERREKRRGIARRDVSPRDLLMVNAMPSPTSRTLDLNTESTRRLLTSTPNSDAEQDSEECSLGSWTVDSLGFGLLLLVVVRDIVFTGPVDLNLL